MVTDGDGGALCPALRPAATTFLPAHQTKEHPMIIDRTVILRRAARLASALALIAVTGCATHVSRDLGDDGQAGEVVFPDRDAVLLDNGTYPPRSAFASIAPGMTRDQLYDLLGRPHFRAGFKAREWDYLFHFRAADGSVTSCQYKVLFDRERIARGFHWLPESCAGLVAAPDTSPGPVLSDGRAVLPADALFRFARHGAEDILPEGRAMLDRLLEDIRQAGEVQVRVTGHTDHIGSDADNALLSERRARTVRDLLVAGGVPAEAILAAGRGEREPVKACDGPTGQALVDCLAPNRRVEIEVRPR